MPFDYLDIDDLCRAFKNETGRYRYVVTPNVDHVVRLSRCHDRMPFYMEADFSVCDSRVIYVLSRLKWGSNIKAVVAGSDLVCHLFDNVITSDTAVTIIGGVESVIETLKDRYTLHNIRHYNPPMGFGNDSKEVAKTVDFITAAPSKYIFICVGSPQQEVVAKAVRDSGFKHGVGLCVGASLLFLTGHERRAPKWMQNMALEWLYRLLRNPRRLFRRYLVDSWKIFVLFINDFFRK